MNCPQCGGLMAKLVECHKELDIGPNDETTQKLTTHLYRQCNNDGCKYAETVEVQVEESTLPYYAAFI